jgi:hypothetical protein
MNEQVLKDYFDRRISVVDLANDLKHSQQRTGYDTKSIIVTQIEEGSFQLKTDHLIRLCDEVINGRLALIDLNTIAFAINFSTFFILDSNNEELIQKVLFDWDNPDLAYDLTLDNILLWKQYLNTGDYGLELINKKK